MASGSIEVLFDHVVDAGVFRELDYDYVGQFADRVPGQGGGCTAVAATTWDGRHIVGRNMDLAASHKPAFVVRTRIPGDYETLGLAYITTDLVPDWSELLERGMDDELAKELPFLCTDVLNERGLYVSTNMRNGEVWPDGSSKFGTTGTNPDASETVQMFSLPRILGQRCATVVEALEYLGHINVVGGKTPDAWNFAFMLADSDGHHGVLEIVRGEIAFVEDQHLHTNFYVHPRFRANELYTCGIGRYTLALARLKDMHDDADMLALMNDLAAFKMYSKTCPYDVRTEYVGYDPAWTGAFVLDEQNRETIERYWDDECKTVGAMTRDELMDACQYWESTFTELVDCSSKTLRVRFFEDDAKQATLRF